MKLRNKRTGEIKEWDFGNWYQHILNPDNEESYECTLSEFIDRTAEFREEWEDVPEEPKEYWFIDYDGGIVPFSKMRETATDKSMKQIGNYFETEEEAEKAVEKLKAWKRLKDGGITFKNWTINQTGTIDCFATWGDNIPPSRKNPTLLEDLDLLFGGKE